MARTKPRALLDYKMTRNIWVKDPEYLRSVTVPSTPGVGPMPILRLNCDQRSNGPRPMSPQGLVRKWKPPQKSSSPRPRSWADILPCLRNQMFKASGSRTQPCFPKVKFPSKVEFGELVTGWLRTQSCVSWKGEDIELPRSWFRPHAWKGCQGNLITNIYQWPGEGQSVGEAAVRPATDKAYF